MNTAEDLTTLFAISVGLWSTAAVLFVPLYLFAAKQKGFRLPFVTITAINGITNLFEAIAYLYIITEGRSDDFLIRLGLYYVPIGLIVRAVLYLGLGVWVALSERPSPARTYPPS